MTFEVFLGLLFAVTSLAMLFTEGLKKALDEAGKTYRTNLLAGAVAGSVSVLLSAGYIIITETAFNAKMAVYLIALVLLSWLSSMLGYDKIKQTLLQIKGQ